MTFDPDTSLSILSLMDAECDRARTNRWDRSAPENYRLGNTTFTGVGSCASPSARAAPRRPPEDRTKDLERRRGRLQQQRQRLQPAAARLAGGRESAAAARRRRRTGWSRKGVGEGEPRAMPGGPPDGIFEV